MALGCCGPQRGVTPGSPGSGRASRKSGVHLGVSPLRASALGFSRLDESWPGPLGAGHWPLCPFASPSISEAPLQTGEATGCHLCTQFRSALWAPPAGLVFVHHLVRHWPIHLAMYEGRRLVMQSQRDSAALSFIPAARHRAHTWSFTPLADFSPASSLVRWKSQPTGPRSVAVVEVGSLQAIKSKWGNFKLNEALT